jgi:cobalt-zinc-cadmium efflux system membrane fusion protein
MFGQAEISSVSGPGAPYVPDSAIERYGDDTFVFLDKGKNHFEKRKVNLGSRIKDGYQIKSGIAYGERIVTSGALTLKAELFKNQVSQD